ncbi:crotonase/enoyl-CoA hydratase family protein [Aquabacterium sp.]|uniref:crotonase/enoyl-CoA hydratase family protein n=1 Tax=Aquabacterium sp. TaxID=1872578 RepID=UPI002C34EA43|nr:crotonase/enoyl-CoA hydratase family protein [Aquabacterium sp.]HSW08296.1 crotonase/enoyl-CoA hydratase family protein [Aquabacterium sp.]
MEAAVQDRIRISIDALGVAEVCLARPDKMNALDFAMFDAIAAAIDQLKSERGLRAVVLHGEGRAFCAGLDMGRMDKIAAAGEGGFRDLRPRSHGTMNSAQYVAQGWRELVVPVIAAVHGVAFGGGLQVALGADIRLISADLKMSVMEVKWGLVPDMAGIVLMRGLLRDDVVRELTYTGRVVDAEEAVQLGLATRVCADPLAAAREMAAGIAQRSPDAVRAAKRLLNQAAAGTGDAALLQAESNEQVALMGAPNQVEAVRANLEKRAPVFHG